MTPSFRSPVPPSGEPTARVSEHAARLREQTAFARGRCAALHELDLEDREIPCRQCRDRAAELYPTTEPQSVCATREKLLPHDTFSDAAPKVREIL